MSVLRHLFFSRSFDAVTVSTMTASFPATNGVHKEPLPCFPAGGVTSPRIAGVSSMLPAIKTTTTLSVPSPQHESLSQVRDERAGRRVEGRVEGNGQGKWEECVV